MASGIDVYNVLRNFILSLRCLAPYLLFFLHGAWDRICGLSDEQILALIINFCFGQIKVVHSRDPLSIFPDDEMKEARL